MISRCPHSEPFEVGGRAFTAAEIIAALAPMLLEERRRRIDAVVAERTYSVVPVLEGLYDLGNVSAVLRSAEALGFQSVHIVDSSPEFKAANRVTQGAEKWLDIHVWPDTPACVTQLRDRGYRILATHFDCARPIEEIAFDAPAAIVFGNERDGVSPEMLACADERIIIPMPGFSRSFNISVAAAIALYHIRRDRIARLGRHGDLDAADRRILTASYYLRSIVNAESILLRSTRQ